MGTLPIKPGSAGVLNQVFDPATPNTPYWQTLDWDEGGHPFDTQLRNGVETMRMFDPAVGRLDAILAGPLGGSSVQSLNYTWDPVGNLLTRTDQNQNGLKEAFTYDALNRLKTSTLTIPGVGTVQTLALAYAANGNIASTRMLPSLGQARKHIWA